MKTERFFRFPAAFCVCIFLTVCVLSARAMPADSLSALNDRKLIAGQDFNPSTATDPLEMLMGAYPGLAISKKGSDPNEMHHVLIRGLGSLYSDVNPLIVIDGMEGADLFMLSPHDIETVEVLKDVAATARYGSRGGNGVILVTTRRADAQQPMQLSFHTAIGSGSTAKRLPLLTAQDFRSYVAANPQMNVPDGGASTDWQDEVFRNTLSQQYHASLRGSLNQTSWYAGINHQDMPGVVTRSGRTLTGGILNINRQAFDNRLELSLGIRGARSEGETFTYQGLENVHHENPLYATFIYHPTDPVYESDGETFSSGHRAFRYYNPLALLNLIDNTLRNDNLGSTFNIGFQASERVHVYAGGNHNYSKQHEYKYIAGSQVIGRTETDMTDVWHKRERYSFQGGVMWQAYTSSSHKLELDFSYSEVFAEENRESDFIRNNGEWHNMSFAYSKNHTRRLFVDARYNYRQKYFLSAALAGEKFDFSGYSQGIDYGHYSSGEYADVAQRNLYPALTASWAVDQEAFLSGYDAVSHLLISASWGKAGRHLPYSWFDKDYFMRHDIEMIPETTTELSLRGSLGLYAGRLTATLGWYSRNNDDVLIYDIAFVPPYFSRFNAVNAASLRSKGLELWVSGIIIERESFQWSSSLSGNANRVVLKKAPANFYERNLEMYPPGFGRQLAGKTLKGFYPFVFELPVFAEYGTDGAQLFYTDEGNITRYPQFAEKRVSNTAEPSFELFWNNAVSFRQFDFSMMWQYAGGYQVLNLTNRHLSLPMFPQLNGISTALENVENNTIGPQRISTQALEDAGFVRLKSLSLGYTFASADGKWYNGSRIYLAGHNLLTFTSYSGLDPAIVYNNPYSVIDNFNAYPLQRSFLLGFSLKI